MATNYLSSSVSKVQGERATVLGVSTTVDSGSVNGGRQYWNGASGLLPEATMMPGNLDGNLRLGTFDDGTAFVRGIRNYRQVGLPSGYGGQYGQPTFGQGRINTNTTVAQDSSNTASGYYSYLGGRTVKHVRYNGLTS